MQQFQKTKVTVLSNYQQINTVAGILTTNALDIQGAGEAVIDIIINSVATTAMTGIKLQEADTAGGSYSDVSGASFSVVPVASTDDGKVWRIHVPVAQKSLRRYLKPLLTKGDTNVARVTVVGYVTALNEGPVEAPGNGAARSIVA